MIFDLHLGVKTVRHHMQGSMKGKGECTKEKSLSKNACYDEFVIFLLVNFSFDGMVNGSWKSYWSIL